MSTNWVLNKIISGGQTGVDSAALDFALQNNVECGGWCPKGRKAEDGMINIRYPLKETKTKNYNERTEKNVLLGDGTILFYHKEMDEGTLLTASFCVKWKKPILKIDLNKDQKPSVIKRWIKQNNIQALNIAGPRESTSPGIYKITYEFLKLRLLTTN